MFCKPAVRQVITKIVVTFFIKFGVYKFSKNEILHRYFSRVMVKNYLATTEHLFFWYSCEWPFPIINHFRSFSAIKKLGRYTSNSGGKIKTTTYVKLRPCFFKLLERAVVGKLQISKRIKILKFKIFSGTTLISTDQNDVCFFSSYL